jgi:hypothetical protein
VENSRQQTAPAWLNDPAELRRKAEEYQQHFDEKGPDAVCGMAGPDFTAVQFLGSVVVYNSDHEYKPGDVLTLGVSRNQDDGQTGETRARIREACPTPKGYEHYLRRKFSYVVVVD